MGYHKVQGLQLLHQGRPIQGTHGTSKTAVFGLRTSCGLHGTFLHGSLGCFHTTVLPSSLYQCQTFIPGISSNKIHAHTVSSRCLPPGRPGLTTVVPPVVQGNRKVVKWAFAPGSPTAQEQVRRMLSVLVGGWDTGHL